MLGLKSPVQFSSDSRQGGKGPNQDSMFSKKSFTGNALCFLAGVFDGHGLEGAKASQMAMKSYVNAIKQYHDNRGKGKEPNGGDQQSGEFRKFAEDATMRAFQNTDSFLHASTRDFSESGSTAVVVWLQGNELLVANLGDSRCVLGTKLQDGWGAIQLTEDHKPGLPREKKRILDCSGRVFPLNKDPLVDRVWPQTVGGVGLAVSRSFGDTILKGFGLSAEPDLYFRTLTNEDAFLILASDGLWDVLKNDEVVEFVASLPSKKKAARSLTTLASENWKMKFPEKKMDDVSVIVVFLQEKGLFHSNSDSAIGRSSFRIFENDRRARSDSELLS